MELKCSAIISSDLTWHIVLPWLLLSWNNTKTKWIIFKQSSHKAIKIILERNSVVASCILAALWGEVASMMKLSFVTMLWRGLGRICSPCSAVGKHSWSSAGSWGLQSKPSIFAGYSCRTWEVQNPKANEVSADPVNPAVWEPALLFRQPSHFLLVLSFLKAFCCSRLYWVKYHPTAVLWILSLSLQRFSWGFSKAPCCHGNAPHLELVPSPVWAGRWEECYGCCFAASHCCSKWEPPAWEQLCCLCWTSTHAWTLRWIWWT